MQAPSAEITAMPTNVNITKPRLACPFFRFDPCRHYACASYELKGFEAVKKHIERKHILRNHCARCFKSFENETARNDHITGSICPLAPGHDEITYLEWTSTKGCPRTNSCEVKWRWLWATYFNLPALTRELIYFEDAVVEAKRVLIDMATIQSVLKTRLQLDQSDISCLAADIREALLRENSGSRAYRACYIDESSSDKTGPGVDPRVSLGMGNTGADATQMEPTTSEVGNVDLPSEQTMLSQEDPRSPTIEDLSVQPALTAAIVPTLLAESDLNPASILNKPFADNLNGFGQFDNWRMVRVVPWGTADGALARLMEDPISWLKPDGPKWSDLYDHIDRDALRQCWQPGSIPTVQIAIPIRLTHIHSFAAVESKLHTLEGVE
ncbi:hypothetical protein QBC40DRAFT_279024 [Triangularia verruculosa]|uniref:C2H2-type domain-containing protein n=1 Tax=Triangularia verruculosa TaxID=2587418 RepID=A0AAN6XNK9_9PEZI|nr:hypothetical protein QBC40DRAFT_279024 [Triangularia verruculosa]